MARGWLGSSRGDEVNQINSTDMARGEKDEVRY